MTFLKKIDPVTFDPSNPEHRKAVRAFMRRQAWADSPLRFKHDPFYGSVTAQVQSKLLNWYLDQETIKEVKKAERKAEREKARAANNVKFINKLATFGTPGIGKSEIIKSIAGDKKLAFEMMGVASEFKK